MILARVLGRVVSVRRAEGLLSAIFHWIQPLDEKGDPAGRSLVAADTVGAGPGDIVFFVDGREASMALPEPIVPIDAAIVGHVEDVGSPTPFPRHGAAAGP